MKLKSSTLLPGSIAGNQPVADSIGSTTFNDLPAQPLSRAAKRVAQHRLAQGSRLRGRKHARSSDPQQSAETDIYRVHSNEATVTTGTWSMPESGTESAGISFKGSNRPLVSTSSNLAFDTSSGRVPRPAAGTVESHLKRLADERVLIANQRLNNASDPWHDTVFIAAWQRTLEVHDQLEPSARAMLLHALTDAIGDMMPVQRANEAVWQIMERIDALPASQQTSMLQSLGQQMHVAMSDADGRRMFDRLVQHAKELPDREQAKVYPVLLQKCGSLNPAALNHAFVTILRATGTLLPAPASSCIKALTETLSTLQPSARVDALCLLTDLTLAHDSGMRQNRLSGLVEALACLETNDRYTPFARLLMGLARRANDDSPVLIPSLVRGLAMVPENRKMYAFHQIVEVSITQSPATQEANLPVLQRTLAKLERDMSLPAAFDTAALPDTEHADGTLAEMVAGLAGWALKDEAHQHFPRHYLQDVLNWSATRPAQDQQVIFDRLTEQLKLDVALLGCGVRLDQDAIKITHDFHVLTRTAKCLPRSSLQRVVDPLLKVVEVAVENKRPYARHMIDHLRTTVSPDRR